MHAVLRAARQGCPEEGLPPVRFLRHTGWLGRVRISGEETDPCEVQAGRTQVADWRSAYTAHGGKHPAENEYLGLPEDVLDPDDDTAQDRAVAAIKHLPVVFLSGLYHCEQGLSRHRARLPWRRPAPRPRSPVAARTSTRTAG
ncbi:hypothetical protein [Streptomyces sp. NPDC002133]|uniref:hypothetical protein n=1 Tax=Streptomyces sp. NPDC002133 TaxID=3154409 RepID=UPI00332BE314